MGHLHGWRLVALVAAVVAVTLLLWVWLGLNHDTHPTGPTTPQAIA
jgi:predicted MFS family arabinose efflux permease